MREHKTEKSRPEPTMQSIKKTRDGIICGGRKAWKGQGLHIVCLVLWERLILLLIIGSYY